jgi:hypothetical protein
MRIAVQVLPQLSLRLLSDNLQQCSTVFARSVAPRLIVQALVAEDTNRFVDSGNPGRSEVAG